MEGVEVVGERERREGGGSEEGEGVREGLSSALAIAIPPSMWTYTQGVEGMHVPASQRCSSNDWRGGAGGSGPYLVSTLPTATLLSCSLVLLLSGTGAWSWEDSSSNWGETAGVCVCVCVCVSQEGDMKDSDVSPLSPPATS